MSRFKRLLGLAGLTSLLAALALAAPASAMKTDAACLVTGDAKVSDKEDPTIGVRLTGGKGTFEFTTFNLTCVGVSKGELATAMMSAAADGVFVNVVCGTGKAWGTVTEAEGPEKFRNLVIDHNFAVHFHGTTGTFFWHEDKMKTDVPDVKDGILDQITKLGDEGVKPKEEKNWQPAGTIDLSPSQMKEPPDTPRPEDNHCTKAFRASGVVAIFSED